MRTIIIANGVMDWSVSMRSFLREGDLLIAADGGARHCQAFGITPDVVIGDFDSLDERFLDTLRAEGVKLIRYPVEKDFTDLELAIQYAVSDGASEIIVMGALGARWDQTVANLLLPAMKAFSGVAITLVDDSQEIRLLRGGESMVLQGRPGDTLSLIPLAGDAAGITIQGLLYPLHGETLYFGSTRGISNVMQEEMVKVDLERGLLLCVVIHQLDL